MADQSMRDYGLAAPHGPNMTGRHVATADFDGMHMSNTEHASFSEMLLPNDIYDADGTYWADMPLARRAKFVNRTDSAEAAKELRTIGSMIRQDPLSPVGYYFRNMVIPGMGLLLEGYVLFSIGNVKPLLQAAFPGCWDKNTVCDKTWVESLEYLEVSGIIVGQILVGVLGDWLGRRWGLIQDAVIMFVGLLMLTAAWGTTLNGWVICYSLSLFFYGIGVGGEYPMTATSAMENAVGSGSISTRADRLHRGRKVTSAFLMQGWGQFLNQVILILLLLIFHGGKSTPPYNRVLAQWVYRVSFAIPAVGTLWLVYYRTYKMRSTNKHLEDMKKKQSVTGYDVQSLKLTFRYFGGRVFATAGAWYANDIFFYGNKLFQAQFINTITGGSKSVMVTWQWSLVNIAVSLAGYYLASFMIDNKLYGRKWMQIIGFLADFLCFVIPAFNYDYYANGPGVTTFMAMYFISSFFNQFGPNSVTFLVAAEVFPTPVRASAHGFSAACGKAGALTAAVLYSYIGVSVRFLVVPWFGLAGALITLVFLPDTTGMDLKEQERRWNYIRAGREADYHGVAVHPAHLSLWEYWCGLAKQYDAKKDLEQRVEDLRVEHDEWLAARASNEKGTDSDDGQADDDAFSKEVSAYFGRTGSAAKIPNFAVRSRSNGSSSAESPESEKLPENERQQQ